MMCAYSAEFYCLQAALDFFSKIFFSKAAIVSVIAIDGDLSWICLLKTCCFRASNDTPGDMSRHDRHDTNDMSPTY